MLGLGESKEEIVETLKDLRLVIVNILPIGLYIQQTSTHLPVEHISPT